MIGERIAAEFPETHSRFRTQVMPYTYLFTNFSQQGGADILWRFTAITSFVSMLMLVVALNVAILIYARNATRRGEIARLTTTPAYPADQFLVVWAVADAESPSQDEAEEYRARGQHTSRLFETSSCGDWRRSPASRPAYPCSTSQIGAAGSGS